MSSEWFKKQQQKEYMQCKIKSGKLRQCAICKRYHSGYGLITSDEMIKNER